MISIISTNYQCAHALKRHLKSVKIAMENLEYEYVIVDNYSTDGSWEILMEESKQFKNLSCYQSKCTMGTGRNLAFKNTIGNTIVVIDTDTIYEPWMGEFISECVNKYPDKAIQAIYCGVFPRSLWIEVDGRRDMNTCEDFDMWMRIHEIDKMLWYPAFSGKNLKDSSDSNDFASSRYKTKGEKIKRLLKNELDKRSCRKWEDQDLVKLWKIKSVDFGFAPLQDHWFGENPTGHLPTQAKRFLKRFISILTS